MKRVAYILFAVVVLLGIQGCKGTAKDQDYIVQVSLGGWHNPGYTAEEIIDRLEEVTSQINVSKVIIGWSIEPEIYQKVGDYLHAKNIAMLLWLPVFAETEEMCSSTPAVDLEGNIPANFNLTEGEAFLFSCPSDPENARNIISIYDQYFSGAGFDGVFLDRIRTQSFVGGVSGVLSCGCPICAEAYKNEGVDLAEVAQEYDLQADHFFDVEGYTPADGFTFKNPLAAKYFRAKGHIVSGAVAAIADSLRKRVGTIGMDLYAPFMSQFVGQDYAILSRHADFIKPMLYRKTNAPAGMGFEYALLKQALPNAEGYPEIAQDLDFLNSQLQAMEPYQTGKYPGLEINYRQGVAETSAEYVRESAQAIAQHGFNGAVLSWNIMEAPDAHIQALK